MLRWVTLVLLVLLGAVGWLVVGGLGWLGSTEHQGEVFETRVPAEMLEARTRRQQADARDPANLALVTYLGWEWSQFGDRPDTLAETEARAWSSPIFVDFAS